MTPKKRQRKTPRGAHQGRVTLMQTREMKSPSLQIPRPSVTEYNIITVVPVFPGGEAGPPSGSPGGYEVVFVLGVPGIGGAASTLDFEALLANGGDSLLQGSGLRVDLEAHDCSVSRVAVIVPNSQGRLAQVRLTVTADTFAAAEKEAHDEVMPVLSRIAFEADTPLEVTAVLLTEKSTAIRSVGATLIGAVRPAPELAGLMTPELRPFLAAYREGLNSNSPLYQALSFYKVVEGVATFSTKRARTASKHGGATVPDPLSNLIPADANELQGLTDWARGVFTPYLGKTFAEIKEAVSDTIRNSVAHLTPGRDIRVADYLADIHACREVTPILRYMARVLIRNELGVS